MNDFKRKRTPEQNLKKVEGYIPPQQPELEEIILGSLLIDNSVLDKIMVEFSPNLLKMNKGDKGYCIRYLAPLSLKT